MLRSLVLLSAVTLAAAGGRADAQQNPRSVPPPAPRQVGPDDARSILARYVQAWRGSGEMRLADTTTLSFLISGDGGGSFHVVLPPDGSAVLRDGTAGGATISFETDLSFLRRLDRGELNALTAMGQARSSDPVPLRPRPSNGVVPAAAGDAHQRRPRGPGESIRDVGNRHARPGT